MPLMVSGTLLAGCANDKTFVTLEPAGKAFPVAKYQILGKTKHDQPWIDKTIEAEVAGFGFPRPQKRPASWDAKPKPKAQVIKAKTVAPIPQPKPEPIVEPKPAEPVTVPPPPKPVKKHWWQKFKKPTNGQK